MDKREAGIIMMRNEVYISALLRTIGEFYSDSEGYSEYSLELLARLQKGNYSFINDSQEDINNVLSSYQSENKSQKIIRSANQLASINQRDIKDKDQDYFNGSLSSIFANLFKNNNESNDEYIYPLKPLKLTNIFPKKKEKGYESNYKNHIDNFHKEIDKVSNESQLYYLLQKYLWSVPATHKQGGIDVSLFDYTKTKAAITLCLYDQYQNGDLTDDDLENLIKSDKEQFLLISADISGIQDFIFNIPSKGAAKSLKGRSVYLNLIADVVVQYILDELNLKEANLLYNGGGNFYLLVPACHKDKIKEVRKNILNKLLQAHDGEIYFAIDSIAFSPSGFKDFTKLWSEAREKIEKLKEKKWSELGLKENFNKIFEPFDQGNNYCKVCGVSEGKRKLKLLEEGEEKGIKICTLCNSFIDLTNNLKEANYYHIKTTESTNEFEDYVEDYNDIFGLFGYQINLNKRPPTKDYDGQVYKINSTDFIDDGCTGYKFGAYQLPMDGHTQINFKQLAKKSVNEGIGDKKLGLLKLDVDNLGAIFSQGLENNRSILRVTTLSRMLGLYFEGYINQLIEDEGWDQELYVVFSGGDDTFIVGAWKTVFEFAQKFRDKFEEYTCRNPQVTFSAGLGVYRPNYPIIRAADLTEEALDEAKYFVDNDEDRPKKNKLSLFGEVFNWIEFAKVIEIKDFLVKLIVKKDHSRSLLHKVMKSTLGFKKILKASTGQSIHNLRFWRLSYYLRDVKEKNEEDAEKLIDYYREIVIHNLLDKSDDEKISNIMIIPAAVKWAELETKVSSEKEE